MHMVQNSKGTKGYTVKKLSFCYSVPQLWFFLLKGNNTITWFLMYLS